MQAGLTKNNVNGKKHLRNRLTVDGALKLQNPAYAGNRKLRERKAGIYRQP
jgi:hypothetical protein